ncbi:MULTISPECIES: TapY2 family type IVa secretion system protein [unclassified Shewanella]|uniref:TapY2 family type IVa secretion system protein n=1 Tax=unclassified Shewanella TaxID=196818 RepID=UPI00354CFDED
MIKAMALFLMITSFSTFAEEDEKNNTYKCFIETNYGNDIATFFWLPSQAVQEQAAILAQEVSTISGKRAVVRGIEQCVLTEEPFKSKNAQKMDEEISTY